MPLGAIPFPFGICRICSDKATGLHYGVVTCEACKGFFKRSITKGDTYECFYTGSCNVTALTRVRCRACRFKRCMETGMSVDGVRMGRIPKIEKDKALEAFHVGGSNFTNHELLVQQNETGNYEFKLKATKNTTIVTCTPAEHSISDTSKQSSMTDVAKLVCTVKSNTYTNNTTITNTELKTNLSNDYLVIQSHEKKESNLPILDKMPTEHAEHALKRRLMHVSDTLSPSAIKQQTYTWTSQKSIDESVIFPVHLPHHSNSSNATHVDVVSYPSDEEATTTVTEQKHSPHIIQDIHNICCDNPFNDRHTLDTQFCAQGGEINRKQQMSLVEQPRAIEFQELVRNQYSSNILPVELISQTISRSCTTSIKTDNIEDTVSNNVFGNVLPYIEKQNVVGFPTKEGNKNIIKCSVPYVNAIDIHKESTCTLKKHSLSGSIQQGGSEISQSSVYTAEISPILAIGEIPGISQLLIKQESGISQREDLCTSNLYTARCEAEVQIVSHRQRFSPALINVLMGHVLDTSDGAHTAAEKTKQQCQQGLISQRSAQHLFQPIDDTITKASHMHSGSQGNGPAEQSQNEMNVSPFLPENSITGVGDFLHAIETQQCSDTLNEFEFVASKRSSAGDLIYYAEKQGSNARYAYTRTRRVSSATEPSCLGLALESGSMSALRPVCNSLVPTSIRSVDEGLKQQKILLTLDRIGIGMNILNILKPGHRETIRRYKLGQFYIRVMTDSDSDIHETFKKIIDGIPSINERILGFCNNVPGFLELKKADMEVLMQRAYYDIWMLSNAEYFTNGESMLLLPTGELYSHHTMRKILNDKMVDTIFDFAAQFNALKLSDIEIAILCAARLTATEDLDLQDHPSVHKLHSHILDLFVYEVRMNHGLEHSRLLIDLFQLMPLLNKVNRIQQDIIANYSINKFCE